MQSRIVAKLGALQFVDYGADKCVKVELDYKVGGTQKVQCVLLAVRGEEDDKIDVIYGLYAFGWKEADNWMLNDKYWETDDKKKKLKNWITYKAAKKAQEAIQN